MFLNDTRYKSKIIPRGSQPVYVKVARHEGLGITLLLFLLPFTRYHRNTYGLLCSRLINMQILEELKPSPNRFHSKKLDTFSVFMHMVYQRMQKLLYTHT